MDDAGAEALSRAAQFAGWVDNAASVEEHDIPMPHGVLEEDVPMPPTPLPTAAAGAWNPPADWAKGGAKLRAIQASPRNAALGRLSGPSGLVFANPDTGEFAGNIPPDNYVNKPGDFSASPKTKPQIGITPQEWAATAATQEGLAADEADADRRRQAMLDLVNRTKVPAPKPSPSRPSVSVRQVGSGGSVRAPVDLAALAPSGSMERGLAGGAPSPVATGNDEAAASRTPLADGLGRLQSLSGLAKAGNAISRAGARINEALTGAKADTAYYRQLDEDAEDPIRQYVQRQSLAQQEGDRTRKLEEEAALKDPFSAESKRFQAALAKTLPGVYTPEELAQLTAADAPMVTDFAKMKAALDARKPQVDPNADLERRRIEAQIGLTEAQTRAADRRGRGTGTGNTKEQQKIEAEQRKLAERNVGGFEFDPTNPPTVDGAKKMAEASKARDEILGSLERLERLFKDHGTEAGGGAAQSEMESERTNILNRLRVLNEMGVPNGNDYAVLARQVPELTGLGAMFTRNSSFEPKFSALRNQISRTVDATAKAYKFKPVGQSQRNAAPTDSSGRMDLDAATTSVPRRKRDSQGRLWEENPDGTARQVDG